MAAKKRGPAGSSDRRTHRAKRIFSTIVPEQPCFQHKLAPVYQEARNSNDIRVVKLGLDLLWQNLQRRDRQGVCGAA